MTVEIEGVDHSELLDMFKEEFSMMMINYSDALRILRTSDISEKRKDAYFEVFRVFHTLKGTGAYFPEFANLTQFASETCEYYRDLDENHVSNSYLQRWTSLAFSQLSGAYFAIKEGKSIIGFRFHSPPPQLGKELSR